MPIIHLAMDEKPYDYGDMTTGDVAEILEAEYHVMEIFWDKHEADAVEAISDSLSNSFEDQLKGLPFSTTALDVGAKEIEVLFKKFLENKEMDGIVPGVPTGAARLGISHKPKSMRRTPWVSFIDTGLYENNFKCWID